MARDLFAEAGIDPTIQDAPVPAGRDLFAEAGINPKVSKLKLPSVSFKTRAVEAAEPYITPLLQGAYKIGQGGTFGLSDEAAKLLGADSQSMDAAKAQADKDLGGYGTALEIAGAVPAAIASTPTGLITKGAAMAGKYAPAARVVGNAAVNALQGGLYGAGKTDGDISQRAEGAIEPALWAGGLSLAIPPVANALIGGGTKLASVVKNRFASQTMRAQNAARDVVASAKLNPDDIASTLKEYGSEAIPADASEVLRKQGAVSLSRSGGEQQAAMDFLDARQAKQHADLLASVSKGLNVGDNNIYDALAKNKAERSAAAPELYKKAFEQPLPEKFMNDARIRNPEIQDLLEKGKQEAMQDVDRIDPITGINKPPTPVETWHYAKQYLNGQIGAAQRSGASTVNLMKKKNVINNVLRDIPDYVKANDLWADSKALDDAAEFGKGFLKRNPRELANDYASMGDSEKMMAKMSAVDDLVQKFGKTDDNRSVYRELVGNETARKNLETILGKEGLADLTKTAKKWESFSRTRAMVQSQSKTQPFLSTERQMEDIAGASKKSITDSMLSRAIIGNTEPYNNELAKMLMSPQSEQSVLDMFTPANQRAPARLVGRGIGTTIGALDKQ